MARAVRDAAQQPLRAASSGIFRDQESAERIPDLREKVGGVLLSRGLAPRVPSALAGLTSLFGMGRGVSPPL